MTTLDTQHGDPAPQPTDNVRCTNCHTLIRQQPTDGEWWHLDSDGDFYSRGCFGRFSNTKVATPPLDFLPRDEVAAQANNVFEECLHQLQVAMENVQALGRIFATASPETLPHGGPGPLAACRIQRGQQLIHDGHWWHVTSVERCSLESVVLTLMRPGIKGRPVELNVDPDEIFTVAEPF